LRVYNQIYNYTQFRRYRPQYFLALGSKFSNILNIWSKEDITGIIINMPNRFRENQMESRIKKLEQNTSHNDIQNEIIILYLVEYGESILTQLKNRFKKVRKLPAKT